MRKGVITTPADLLIEYLYYTGKVGTEKCAKDLGLPLEQIEEWADILEEHGMVDIGYSPIKGMVLKPKKAIQLLKLKPEALKEEIEKLKRSQKSPKRKITKVMEKLRKRPRVAALKKKKLVKREETIMEKYKESLIKLKKLSEMRKTVKLKKKEAKIREEIKKLGTQVEAIKRAPPVEIKKVRFFDFIKRAEKKAEVVEKELDEFTKKIMALEKSIMKHKERHG